MTGLGERSHLASKDVDLSTHVEDIKNVLFYEDLEDVVLVGHSYAGIVIPCVANEIPERIRLLVFLDALIVDHGMSAKEVYGSSDRASKLYDRAAKHPDGYCPWAEEDLSMWGISGHEHEDWTRQRLTAHPFRTMEGIVEFNNPVALQIPVVYIKCGTVTQEARQLYLDNRGWQLYGLEAGHDAMITAPEELTKLLIQVST